jgi:hypothetical protein
VSYYRCSDRASGIGFDQGGQQVHAIDDQVVAVLRSLKPPADRRSKIAQIVGEILGEPNLKRGLTDIKTTIERLDFRWDSGCITEKAGYLGNRLRWRQELEQLAPIRGELDTAADLLANFSPYWDGCNDDVKKQNQLLQLILDRVYVADNVVVALMLKAD